MAAGVEKKSIHMNKKQEKLLVSVYPTTFASACYMLAGEGSNN
jgi:hypothetical protein